jgi:hypothetical protein
MTVSVAERVARLDPRIPAIDELFAVRRVADLFAHAWRREIRDCRLLGTRYEPGTGCVATYTLAAEDAPATIGVVELTTNGRSVRSYLEDPALPGLATAAEPSAVGALLAGAVQVRQTSVVPVRYVPGQRAVVRYDVQTSSGPATLYGKVVRAGITALAAAFTQLHQRARVGDSPFVPAPTVVHASLGLLVLPEVEGRSLHALAFDPAVPVASRATAFGDAGRALAGLHGGPAPTTVVAPADDVADLLRSADALRAIDPLLAEQWDAALASLAADAGVPEAPVPNHGALRTDQIVLTPNGPALLDLDGFCAAAPARDVGNLLAYLRWRAMRRPADAEAADLGREAVLAGYEEVAGAPVSDLARHEGLSLLKIAARRYRNLDVTEWPLVPELVSTASSLARTA